MVKNLYNPDERGHSEPPEGAIAGEDVPKESEPDNYDEQLIEELMHELKTRGEPWTEMNRGELNDRARELLDKHGVDY